MVKNTLNQGKSNNYSDIVESKLPISVSARVIYQLGEQLISDEFVALAELIKNAYDADCRRVFIEVDTKIDTPHGKGRITIEDNGNGMTKSIIKNAFLRISTNFKKSEKFSPYFKRRTLGEKGLGRLSIQRLGNHVTINTSPRMQRISSFVSEEDVNYYSQYNEYQLLINWLDFRDSTEDISSLNASFRASFTEKPKKGTKLIIEGIRNIDFWKIDRKMETRIKTEIFSMVNPFVQDKSNKFKVYLTIDGKDFSNEEIDEEILDLMSDVNVEFSFSNWILDITINSKKRYLERLSENLIKNMRSKGYEKYELLKPYNSKIDNFQINLLENFTIEYPYLKGVSFQKVNSREYANPGDFSGKIYASDQSSESMVSVKELLNEHGMVFKTIKEIKAIWSASKGVYLFRNDFRILPYGPEKEWLGLTRRSQREKATIYKEHTVSGYVNLGSESSEKIQEQTNRLGLIEDEYGTNFIKLMEEIVMEIAFKHDIEIRKKISVKNSNNISDKLITNDEHIIFYQTEETIEQKQKLIQKVVDETNQIKKSYYNDSQINNITNNLLLLQKNAEKEEQRKKQEQFKYEQQITQLKALVGLAGQGIIIEALTHELNRIEENISNYAKNSKKIISESLSSDENLALLKRNQDGILHEVFFLQEQLSHLEPTYKKNSMLLQPIDVNHFLRELYIESGPMVHKAKKSNVSIKVMGDSFVFNGNKGVLITIFDNLFINSLYWVQEIQGNKSINFTVDSINSTIIVWDTGPGYHEEIVNFIFEPYESMKPDGRGLGLYIVKELVRSLHGTIELKEERNIYGRKYKLAISLPAN